MTQIPNGIWKNFNTQGAFSVGVGRYLNKNFDVMLNSTFIPGEFSNRKIRELTDVDLNLRFKLVDWSIIEKTSTFTPFLSAGLGGTWQEELNGSGNFSIPAGFGIRLNFGSRIGVEALARYHFNGANFQDYATVNYGININFGEGKAPAFVAPPPPPPPPLDSDKDGIIDSEDKCPQTPGIAKFDGCPDTDGDGLQDSEDECPTEAGPVERKGCPVKDKDGDGVEDADDACPDEPGTVANNGCPSKPLIAVVKDKITDEVIPGAELVLLNSSGEMVKTGTTNSLGIVEFENLEPGDYTIEGKMLDISLTAADVKTADFNSSSSVQKTLYYDDPNFIIQGKVVICNSPDPMPGVLLELENKGANFLKTTTSSNDGTFRFYLDSKAIYTLHAKKESFLSQVVDVDASRYDRNKSVFVKLEVCAEEVKCGESIRLNNILYDSNSAAIRSDAKPDLDKVVTFMRDNPDAKVELSSHTDSRGKAAYNLNLSQRRAQAAADYIVAQGVASSRIVGTGYGETKLVNRCADGVRCPDSDHQQNRRTEFKVICPD